MIPSLPNEILASVLSHLEPTRPSDWHYSGPLAALVRCCLVSKLFLDLARPLLYSTHYLDFDPEYSVQATSRTLSCDLALALRPHLAAHVKAVVVDVDADHDDGLDPNIVPLAVAHALRLSPACARLDLSLRIEVVEQSDFLAALVQVVIFARPLLRSFIYSASITIPAASLANLLRALPLLETLKLHPFRIEAADDDHKPQESQAGRRRQQHALEHNPLFDRQLVEFAPPPQALGQQHACGSVRPRETYHAAIPHL